MKSVIRLNNVRITMPGNFRLKTEYTEKDLASNDRMFTILKWATIIAVPIILAIAAYVSTHVQIGDVLG